MKIDIKNYFLIFALRQKFKKANRNKYQEIIEVKVVYLVSLVNDNTLKINTILYKFEEAIIEQQTQLFLKSTTIKNLF